MFGEFAYTFFDHTVHEINRVCTITQHPERPKPLREWDQIYMLAGSLLTQAKLVADYIHGKNVVMIGDGDCMSLVVAVLSSAAGRLGTSPPVITSPHRILVLDFDRRLVKFINDTAAELRLPKDFLVAREYNVMDSVPRSCVGKFDVFYVNPPYGSADRGECGQIFISRGMEACVPNSRGIALLPYSEEDDWSREAMFSIQKFAVGCGYAVSDMMTGLHQYHLADRPTLHSGVVVFDRLSDEKSPYHGRNLDPGKHPHFYGKSAKQIPTYIDLDGKAIYANA